MTTLTRRGLLGLFAAVPAWAADFWDKQPDYRKWGSRNIDKMLQNSPWAQRVTAPMPRGGGEEGGRRRGGGGLGGPGGGAGGFGVPTGGGRQDTRGGGVQGGPSQMELVVRWESAAPVKQAIVASQLQAEGAELTDQMTAYLDQAEEFYILTLSGLPPRMGRSLLENPDGLKELARLERKGLDSILPEQAEARDSNGQAVALYFMFPRSAEITVADKEVEFVFKMTPGRGSDGERGGRSGGGFEVKSKFKLKDMLYSGELSL